MKKEEIEINFTVKKTYSCRSVFSLVSFLSPSLLLSLSFSLPFFSRRDLCGFLYHGGRTSRERQRLKRGAWFGELRSQEVGGEQSAQVEGLALNWRRHLNLGCLGELL